MKTITFEIINFSTPQLTACQSLLYPTVIFFICRQYNSMFFIFHVIMFRTLTYSCLTKRRRKTQTNNQRCAVTHGTFVGESDDLLLACTPSGFLAIGQPFYSQYCYIPVVRKSENILGPFICTEKILFNRKTRMLQNS